MHLALELRSLLHVVALVEEDTCVLGIRLILLLHLLLLLLLFVILLVFDSLRISFRHELLLKLIGVRKLAGPFLV